MGSGRSVVLHGVGGMGSERAGSVVLHGVGGMGNERAGSVVLHVHGVGGMIVLAVGQCMCILHHNVIFTMHRKAFFDKFCVDSLQKNFHYICKQ